MKKLFLLSLLALAAPLSLLAVDKTKHQVLVERVESCEAILQEFQAKPETAIPASVFQRARAIVILNQGKFGFLLGLKEGYGVILAKRPDGSWSLPVLISAGESSIGLQVGASTQETILIFTDDQTARILFKKRFNVGLDAKAVAGPRVAEKENDNKPLIQAPVLVYAKNKGLYAGATIKSGYIARDDGSNRELYHTQYTLPELLFSNWVTPIDEVRPLMNLVQKLAP